MTRWTIEHRAVQSLRDLIETPRDGDTYALRQCLASTACRCCLPSGCLPSLASHTRSAKAVLGSTNNHWSYVHIRIITIRVDLCNVWAVRQLINQNAVVSWVTVSVRRYDVLRGVFHVVWRNNHHDARVCARYLWLRNNAPYMDWAGEDNGAPFVVEL